MTNSDRPRYRVLSEVAFISGAMYEAGSEIVSEAWPKGELAPLNPTARKVAAYFRQWQACPGFPSTPYNSKLGRLFLPGHLPRMAPSSPNAKPGSEILGLIPETHIDPELAPPRYKMRVAHLVGSRELRAGEEFAFIGWPALEIMEPVDDQARAISVYLVANEDSPHLMTCPWCCAYGLTLPALPPPPRKPNFQSGVIRGGRQHAEDQRAIESEVEAVTGRAPGETMPIPKTFPSGVTNSTRATPAFKPGPSKASRQPGAT